MEQADGHRNPEASSARSAAESTPDARHRRWYLPFTLRPSNGSEVRAEFLGGSVFRISHLVSNVRIESRAKVDQRLRKQLLHSGPSKSPTSVVRAAIASVLT